MNSKERVLTAIRHEEPDRVPINIWMLREDMQERVIERYGSMDEFYKALDIDLFMAITPPPNKNNLLFMEERMTMTLDEISDDDFLDPDDERLYIEVKQLVEEWGEDKAVLAHVWGVVESAYSFMGIQNTLYNMAARPEEIKVLFKKLSDWSARVADNVTELGIDVLHISGDAGMNTGCLFSPKAWWEFVYPNDKVIIEVGKRKGFPISMHSCGNINDVLDGVVKMGVDLLHPVQTSAGMNPAYVKKEYGLAVHGGLEIRYILPRAPIDELIDTVKNWFEVLKPGGGFIFNTEHTVQPDTTLDRVEIAYETALKYAKY